MHKPGVLFSGHSVTTHTYHWRELCYTFWHIDVFSNFSLCTVRFSLLFCRLCYVYIGLGFFLIHWTLLASVCNDWKSKALWYVYLLIRHFFFKEHFLLTFVRLTFRNEPCKHADVRNLHTHRIDASFWDQFISRLVLIVPSSFLCSYWSWVHSKDKQADRNPPLFKKEGITIENVLGMVAHTYHHSTSEAEVGLRVWEQPFYALCVLSFP